MCILFLLLHVLIIIQYIKRTRIFGGPFLPLQIKRDGTLLIKRVQEGDAGVYSCIPFSSLGAGAASPPVEVVVRGMYDQAAIKIHKNSPPSFDKSRFVPY